MKKRVLQAMAILMFLILSALGAMAGQEAPRASIDIGNHPYKGPANAPVVRVVFSDYL
jgi:hypothetical protein